MENINRSISFYKVKVLAEQKNNIERSQYLQKYCLKFFLNMWGLRFKWFIRKQIHYRNIIGKYNNPKDKENSKSSERQKKKIEIAPEFSILIIFTNSEEKHFKLEFLSNIDLMKGQKLLKWYFRTYGPYNLSYEDLLWKNC